MRSAMQRPYSHLQVTIICRLEGSLITQKQENLRGWSQRVQCFNAILVLSIGEKEQIHSLVAPIPNTSTAMQLHACLVTGITLLGSR